MIKNKKFLLMASLFALALLLAACGGGGGDSSGGSDSGGSETAESGDPSNGQSVYENNCLSCHGEQGEGASGPNLQESEVAQEQSQVEDKVRNGGNGMPSFEGDLSDSEIADVAAYISEEVAQ
ncbi:c-type cytochrome [Sediminibacillus dalangtanensis]|uniref:C-type cytochrome n=1 Tax=Sediminibacillus dalangtanensis TaxID=2729421 RepID=A0ABX7VSD6_9BACI|nr:cytochrome c [Sediminibacillus dalangtanensis]QTM99556.1 c-type cytochrome [Sediminibacillus dalangtanensis]